MTLPMSEDCIFCKIVAGEIPCSKVYETDSVLAFLDIEPVNPGHALVIPKAHHPQIWDVPDALGAELATALKIVSKGVFKATGADGLNIGMNNFAAAGQLVMHAHYHVIPRFDADGLTLWPGKKYLSMNEMNELALKISSLIA